MKSRHACHDCGYTEFLGVECAWPASTCINAPRVKRVRRAMRMRRMLATLAVALLMTGLWQVGHAGYIYAKAYLAQVLIADAWARTHAGEPEAKPWPWADTWPVARLRAPAQDEAAFVLAGANGRTIAFGPGHMFGTPLPGEPGNSVIGAHRDTHFAFLQRVRIGDLIEVDTPQGRTVRYRVTDTRIVDKSDLRVLEQPDHLRELTLVTCYPFDAIRAGGPLRYVVQAREVRQRALAI